MHIILLTQQIDYYMTTHFHPNCTVIALGVQFLSDQCYEVTCWATHKTWLKSFTLSNAHTVT